MQLHKPHISRTRPMKTENKKYRLARTASIFRNKSPTKEEHGKVSYFNPHLGLAKIRGQQRSNPTVTFGERCRI